MLEQNKSIRVGFAGTPAFAATHLQALINSQYDVVAVYTQPDKPVGRGKKVQQSPVKTVALEHQIPVLQPKNFRAQDTVEELADYQLDILVVVAYGVLLPKTVLQTPRFGCINVHGSLLPRWRGAAPVQRAILAGDTITGICIMQMDEGLDTGPVLHQKQLSIAPGETSETLFNKLSAVGPDCLITALSSLEGLSAQPQSEEGVTYAHKLDKREAEIEWHATAEYIERQIRGFYPWPKAWFYHPNGLVIKVHKAQAVDLASLSLAPGEVRITDHNLYIGCSHGQIQLERLQLPNKSALLTIDLLNGHVELFQNGQILAHSGAQSS